MEKPATDIYTFETLRLKGYTYVDKTDIILPLVNDSIDETKKGISLMLAHEVERLGRPLRGEGPAAPNEALTTVNGIDH